MDAYICGTQHRDWPDCFGSASYGPSGCTCWEPIYDLEQQPLDEGVEPSIRVEKCVDCAYRPGSPERSGDPDAAGDYQTLREIAQRGETFWCHQGMRRPARWRHPSGATIPGSPLNYEPPRVGNTPYKADGTPGDICAGWAALRLAALHRQTQPEEDTNARIA